MYDGTTAREARHIDVRRLIVEGAEVEEPVPEERSARLEVRVVTSSVEFASGRKPAAAARASMFFDCVAAALIGLQRRCPRSGCVPLLVTMLMNTPPVPTAMSCRARRHLDVLERRRHVVVHREALRRGVVDVDAVEHLGVLRVRRAARRERALQSALVAADVGRFDDHAGRLVFDDVPDVAAARRFLEERRVDVDAWRRPPWRRRRATRRAPSPLRRGADLHRDVDARASGPGERRRPRG